MVDYQLLLVDKAHASPDGSARRPHVEDNDDERAMYATFLARAGFQLVMARSANEGFVIAASTHPDVIVVDERLPGAADGIALGTRLRLDVRTGRIPIILLTGGIPAKDRARAASIACDVLLVKPCAPSLLEHHARTLLPQQSPQSRTAP